MMPEKFESHVVRLFVKTDDEVKFNEAKEVFKLYCQAILGGEPNQIREMAHS